MIIDKQNFLEQIKNNSLRELIVNMYEFNDAIANDLEMWEQEQVLDEILKRVSILEKEVHSYQQLLHNVETQREWEKENYWR